MGAAALPPPGCSANRLIPGRNTRCSDSIGRGCHVRRAVARRLLKRKGARASDDAWGKLPQTLLVSLLSRLSAPTQ
eukprot:334888-Chlamydomonas_euryale.AAC.6